MYPTQFQVKEEKVKTTDDSLSEEDPPSKTHPLSEASSSLSGWKTLGENKLEIYSPNEDIVSSRAQRVGENEKTLPIKSSKESLAS